MKTSIVIFILLLSPLSLSQQFESRSYEFAFNRIEQAFNTASVSSIEDLFSSTVRLRIEDSLYKDVTDAEAQSLLNEYFQSKKSIKFRFIGNMNEGTSNGVLTYLTDKKIVEINVDVYLNRALISAINISNLPSSTALY